MDSRLTDVAADPKARLRRIWDAARPVVFRRLERGELLSVRLQYSSDNKEWLKAHHRDDPIWDPAKQQWRLPRSWFSDFVNRALHRYGRVYIIQPYREQERCAPACMTAKRHECQCSCMGANHGAGQEGGWFVISDAFACRWGEQTYACRLLTKKTDSGQASRPTGNEPETA